MTTAEQPAWQMPYPIGPAEAMGVSARKVAAAEMGMTEIFIVNVVVAVVESVMDLATIGGHTEKLNLLASCSECAVAGVESNGGVVV